MNNISDKFKIIYNNFLNDKNILKENVKISQIDIENKWHEQDGKCYWTGIELDISKCDANKIDLLMPCIDVKDTKSKIIYDNFLLTAYMIKNARNQCEFDKFHEIMIEITESAVSTKTSPAYIRSYFIEKNKMENMKKQIESTKKPDITWDDIFFINPKLKSVFQKN